MTVGSPLVRSLVAFVAVAVTFVFEVVLPSLAARRERRWRLRMPREGGEKKCEGGSAKCEGGRVKCEGGRAEGNELPRSPRRPQTPEERESRKAWAVARLKSHSKIPSWSRDKEYLSLVLEAADGGCGEALNKLGEYAYRRGDWVEAYYWKLKLEMSGGRITGHQLQDIQGKWIKNGCPDQHDRTNSGFSEMQSMFARAVLRVRSGKKREKGLARLGKLIGLDSEDARTYVERNNLSETISRLGEGA